jgi:Skp family chaperone for outer membrane proteins
MVKISLTLSAFLLLLTTTSCTDKSNTTDTVEDNVTTTSEVVATDNSTEKIIESTGKMGFFNLDSLNSKLSLFKEIETEIQASAKKAEQKMKNKQAEINNWEKKWSSKGQLLSSEQEKYMQEAQQMQQKAAMFEQNVQMQMQQEQAQLMETYALRLSGFTKDYAQSNGFDAIQAYQFGQSLWYYNPTLDITDELAKIMNDDYNSSAIVQTEEN